ncbi:glyoxalase/bleomycin resistance/dioxygenase family protein [Micromonospora musae]|uniref:Glyoxalase/bleomycin resistance/dioxygenase family protein n=1 Tax=Micromonospora musae TaxID=1894970 RepID=A0A3A9Y9L6_9ACTN|nr:ArsI/CadI family heavy metal resistance metalloenzyme [Micromonospora musae]RKN22208.1 glyoxalase/bleomycin resistance/dioxygenase family protein [Micromonospora musae]RKN33968.1 glyoxalase/bleomycin resistance/dioxygenase family protein [Micromonospora musae]
MSRVQLALRVSDLEGSVAFYSKLFGVEPAKRRPGYANFAVENPPLKLVLLEGEADQPTVMDHLGVEVFSTDDVNAATARLTDSGLITLEEKSTECCYALQDKVWVRGPGNEPWEVYTVKADAETLAKTTEGECRCGEPNGVAAEQATVASGAGSRCC